MSRSAAHDEVWIAVHAALDERRDPLDDARVIAALEAAPELLTEVAALCAGLRALPTARPAPRRRVLPLLIPGAAAAAALLVFAFWPRDYQPLEEEPLHVAAPNALQLATPEANEPRGGVLLATSFTEIAAASSSAGGVLAHRQTLTFTRP